VSGRWVELEREWQDSTLVNCEVCGRLIPRRAWVFGVAGGELEACSEACEELYVSYVEPTHGPIEPKGSAG
jgi:hypothetical protein